MDQSKSAGYLTLMVRQFMTYYENRWLDVTEKNAAVIATRSTARFRHGRQPLSKSTK